MNKKGWLLLIIIIVILLLVGFNWSQISNRLRYNKIKEHTIDDIMAKATLLNNW